MITNYISGADAVFMCYDITNYESFANLEDWYRLVLRTFYGQKMPYVALLGNKSKFTINPYPYLYWRLRPYAQVM
jgi:Ras-related protein Rab-28